MADETRHLADQAKAQWEGFREAFPQSGLWAKRLLVVGPGLLVGVVLLWWMIPVIVKYVNIYNDYEAREDRIAKLEADLVALAAREDQAIAELGNTLTDRVETKRELIEGLDRRIWELERRMPDSLIVRLDRLERGGRN